MAQHLDDANRKHVENFGDKGKLVLSPPSKKLIVVTCMDARIDTSSAFGLNEGEAHVIRNAGGRVQDSLRSIIVSQRLLATNEIAVVQHTDCGMLTFKNPDLQGILAEQHPEEKDKIDSIDFLPIPNLEGGVREDVQWLKEHPLVLKETVVTGWVYDVKTGKVSQVA
ncbi:carbonic anhydrase [Exidia glandulosa HHB12029]|uniref:Carbonic anhydrase n=1 Tax=Exidia glandulosa HHB12029 TaxID=1314781 RepID=A0A165HVK6_EXIGL|nr:carbonic anhydrase [Exidia glandulosa HHB12029]KZV95589.1 carbonic anhydrase [Exidia glandulosa HHB12029]